MKRRGYLTAALGLGVSATTAGCVGSVAPALAGDDYERAEVVVRDEGGCELARVDVRIADTTSKRYLGLSDTESLGPDEGMLFVHEQEGEYAYVMRDMDFPLDIVFADADGVVTTVHHAPLPEDPENLERYRGRGKYVLEVNMDYTTDHGIDVGDTFDIVR